MHWVSPKDCSDYAADEPLEIHRCHPYCWRMPKRSSRRRQHEDANELAARVIMHIAAESEAEDTGEPDMSKDGKNPAAVALGRLGGKKGGPARAAKLTPDERSAIARTAALARWRKAKNRDKSD